MREYTAVCGMATMEFRAEDDDKAVAEARTFRNTFTLYCTSEVPTRHVKTIGYGVSPLPK